MPEIRCILVPSIELLVAALSARCFFSQFGQAVEHLELIRWEFVAWCLVNSVSGKL